jgi:hypothetical protein
MTLTRVAPQAIKLLPHVHRLQAEVHDEVVVFVVRICISGLINQGGPVIQPPHPIVHYNLLSQHDSDAYLQGCYWQPISVKI